MAKRAFNKDAPFQSLRGASYLTGLSIGFLREGCKKNSIPHIMAYYGRKRIPGEYAAFHGAP